MLLKYYQVESDEGLKKKVFEEASLYLCVKSNRIFMDPIGGKTLADRVELTGTAEILENEEARLAIKAPIPNKVYYVKANKYIYIYYDNTWNCFTGADKDDVTFDVDMLTVNSLGGIGANEDLNGMSVKDVLKKLLYPYVAPVITAATATPTNGGVFEKGSNKQIQGVKVSVTKKSEKITKIDILNGGSVLGSKSDASVNNGGTFNFVVDVPVNSVNVQLTAKVTDASGKSVSKSTGYFNFVYPYYVGACATGATIDEALVKGLTKRVESKSNKIIAYNTNDQRMVFAYPKSYGNLSKIIDPNNFDVTGTFTKSEVSITGLDGTAQAYYVYVNAASTVSNFNMTFNY